MMKQSFEKMSSPVEFLVRRAVLWAFVAPALFSILFFFTYPPVPSEGPDRFVAWPSASLTALGVMALLFVVHAVYRALRAVGLSVRTLVAMLLAGAFTLELLFAAWLISQRPI